MTVAVAKDSIAVIRQLLFGAVVIFMASASAAPPPSLPFESMDWAPSLQKEPTKGISLGTLHVEFEKTTLSEVQRAASTGVIDEAGDGAEHALWLCYSVSARRTPVRIWIISDGEMGGSTHLITGITVSRARRTLPASDCPLLPGAMQPAHFDVPVWVDGTDAQVESALGMPSYREGEWRSFNFQTKVADDGQCDGGYDMLNWMFTQSERGIVISIYAGQVTSC